MASTGILFDPKAGVTGAFSGKSAMPRSVASDGSTMKLVLHVLVHVVALAFHIIACVDIFGSFPQSQMKVASVVAVVMHFLAIVGVLVLAGFFVKQVANTLTFGFVLSFLISAFAGSLAMMVFSFRSDDVLDTSHWALYASVYMQSLGLGLVLANALNMAANGDNAMPKAASKAETAPLASSA